MSTPRARFSTALAEHRAVEDGLKVDELAVKWVAVLEDSVTARCHHHQHQRASFGDRQTADLGEDAWFRRRRHTPECAIATRSRGTIAIVRVLVQRVSSARVVVDGDVVGHMSPAGQGLLALVGVTHSDDEAIAQKMAEKLWQLRILDGELSAEDLGAPVLVVSQFTLYANTTKGRRPSWNAAAPGAVAEPLVLEFVSALRLLGAHVETGVFGADMSVELVNDGPVTVLLEL